MKKLILEQLLGEKPSILESKSAKSSIEYELLYKREIESQDDNLFKYTLLKRTSTKLTHYEQLIFLRIFKALCKKNKNKNQLNVASELKALFKEVNLDRKFKYKFEPYSLIIATGKHQV